MVLSQGREKLLGLGEEGREPLYLGLVRPGDDSSYGVGDTGEHGFQYAGLVGEHEPPFVIELVSREIVLEVEVHVS